MKICVWRALKTNTITPCYYDNDRYFEAIIFGTAARLKIEILCSEIFSNRSFIAPVCVVILERMRTTFSEQFFFVFDGNFSSFRFFAAAAKNNTNNRLEVFPSRMSPKKYVRLNVNLDFRITRKCFRFISFHTAFWKNFTSSLDVD